MASMFETIADMLRGSAPDDLAHALGTDRTQTRRAMEIGLPALITGLRDKTLEPGGAQNLAGLLRDQSAALPSDVEAYLSAGDPSQGAAMLDVAFGDRGEPALSSLSAASGLSTRLLAQVMSVLAPLATGVLRNHAPDDADGLRSYLAGAVDDLEAKGFGRVVELVSPSIDDLAAAAPVADPPSVIDEPAFADPDEFAGQADEPAADSGSAIGAAAALGGAEFADDITQAIDIDSDTDDTDRLGGTVADTDTDADNVVQGAFPDPGGGPGDYDLVFPDPDLVDIDDPLATPTEAVEVPGDPLVGASIAAGGAESSFADEYAAAADDIDFSATPLADEPEYSTPADQAVEFEYSTDDTDGRGLSAIGWIWWLVGAILAVLVLLFLISQCTGDDETADVGTTDDSTAAVAPTPTPDPLVAQRQAVLDEILVDYPGVTGVVHGEVAVLTGTVADMRTNALLDGAVRATGMGVQNNVQVDESAAAEPAGYSINDLIDAQPELSTLRALLDQAGLGAALDGNGPYTLLAPTNDAFAAIQTELAEVQNDPELLTTYLQYHLLTGEMTGATIAQAETLQSISGEIIDVSVEGGAVRLNDFIPVLVADATARNGVMHVISGVLVPPSATPIPAELGEALGLSAITFAPGSSDLTDAGRTELDKVVAFLLETPVVVEIGGHTDADGDEALNQSLSQQRADAVKDYLTEQGVPAESLTAVGYGEASPVAPNDTAENKAKNRRIEFTTS